ncbi:MULTISPECIES: 16S rRNA (uracil(1498)-N(3))-methyltransferase [Flavobacterium]|uniref:Ribosomal RNA small subunit methyltransferase E n=2 Tax=Flavobacterium TaxID=237 RepID=A0AA94F1J6_9FLAO|nr:MULTISPECIES: 16S rRNA (uracil(1498)-N(3))-methyltransferase [Flavobacterium]OXA75070.1 16S rRNA (uracil(1498)-N(3))-methyltransferase [Flavobacterium columnare NBRC 100251 = ATCC 23463]AMA48780.1 16S rRNA methyltransferase [Flavobacterium covae]MCH4830741.1 16S rRNA (uracil(1498)-N(3))-methyltransferase [Flavobacterium columnare]MCH4833322.1 16S rRNA (uracil(1498)-N(3))-methyltransferase [Flavobacterium columnare]MCJ1805471.1 16S rRNA (uracil(1498)-N(3))-methyltransferase [Flavobacterium c
MQLFYNPDITIASTDFSFDKEESKHIVKVLRKKEGDILFVTNGVGFLFETEITLASEKKCSIKINNHKMFDQTGFYLHLAVAPTKMNERYEWFLEKATEIGIHEITPIICEHSERTTIKVDRFDKILQSAMKQSNQFYLPKLNNTISFKDFISKDFEGQLFVAHCEDSDKKKLKNEINPNSKYTILIGPEGDFSEKEIKLAIDKGFIPVTLGNTRLRTETAAVIACHSVVFSNE